MEQKYTISETFTLPSQGKIYTPQINPEIELRSMNTRDEMKRLSPSEHTYKPLCDMIEGCISLIGINTLMGFIYNQKIPSDCAYFS